MLKCALFSTKCMLKCAFIVINNFNFYFCVLIYNILNTKQRIILFVLNLLNIITNNLLKKRKKLNKNKQIWQKTWYWFEKNKEKKTKIINICFFIILKSYYFVIDIKLEIAPFYLSVDIKVWVQAIVQERTYLQIVSISVICLTAWDPI